MANNRKYDPNACLLLYGLGYSYQDIADIYTELTHTQCSKSAVYKILKDKNIRRAENRVNPTKLKQNYINFLQEKGLFLHVLELYNKKYTKPVKDMKFGSKDRR